MIRNTDLAAFVAEKHEISESNASAFVDAAFALILDGLQLGEIVKVKGLGTFKVMQTKERESVDVNTGERILLGSKPKVIFTPDMVLRERVNAPFAGFSSVPLSDGVEVEAESSPTKPAAPTVDSQPDATETQAKEAEQPSIIITGEPAATEKIQEEEKTDITEEKPEIAHVQHPSEAEEGDDEEETAENSSSPLRKWVWILSALLLLSLCCCGYLLWRLEKVAQTPMLIAGDNKPTEQGDTALSLQTKKSVDTAKVTAKNALPDTAATPIRPNEPAVKAESPRRSATTATPIRPNDPRIKYGAYYIIGTQQEVVVQKGQTFSGICHAYLGDGMECYVEVLNGKKQAQPGDTIRIPKLITKKAWKKRMKN